MDMRLEVVVVPVTDVDRAKDFYTGLGWRLDESARKELSERRSYASFATFGDPDGNEWFLQEITERLPGR